MCLTLCTLVPEIHPATTGSSSSQPSLLRRVGLHRRGLHNTGSSDLPGFHHRHNHPPVYCAADLEMPPPSYQAVDLRRTTPPEEELRACRAQLAKLEERQRRENADEPVVEWRIRNTDILLLRRWIHKLDIEAQRMHREEEETRLVRHGDPTSRLQPDRRHELAWERFSQPRLVRPQLFDDQTSLHLHPRTVRGPGERSTEAHMRGGQTGGAASL